jgi:hypothetical protein
MRARLTYANVIATIALFFALGLGGAWAANQLKKNSVSSKQVKNETLVSKDLKNGKAVKGSDVAEETLSAANVKELAPAEAPRALTLQNGGEGDCIWSLPTSVGITPPPTPMSGKDAIGRVSLQGIAEATDGPGGDSACDNQPDPEAVEDLTIATLPPSQQPASTRFFSVSPDNGVIVVGVNGATVGFTKIPPGAIIAQAVLNPGPTIVFLDGVSFQAADATALRGADDRPDRISAKLLKSLGG